MSESCTVLIAAADLLPALKAQTNEDGNEVLVFPDTEAIHALDVITKRRPAVVALERLFAATSRGVALINRIKADPALASSEVRMVSSDAGPSIPAQTPTNPALVLDQHGTRSAPRFTIGAGVELLVDGNPATLVDMSATGAQVLSRTVLKPNQRVRVTMADDRSVLRANATVAWATFEIPSGDAPRYRAGLAFLNTDPAALQAFCLRNGRRSSSEP